MQKLLEKEYSFLKAYKFKSIAISTTAKHSIEFSVLPRRVYEKVGISSFMINDANKLIDVLKYYDGLIDFFYIDIELKQEINLYEIAKKTLIETEIIAIKPNDITLESTDILIREKYSEDLMRKNILIIGTGNLASKIATRLAERQANVYIKARTSEKAIEAVKAINLFLPSYSEKIKPLKEIANKNFDIVIGAISSEFTEEDSIIDCINENTLFIDVGINNFRDKFIKKLLKNGNELLRLDTRIALAYQMLRQNNYTQLFFKNNMGEKLVGDVTIVAGGIIGKEGSVIVDRIEKPTQVIGIADGAGGVKRDETVTERNNIRTINQYISKNY